MSGPARLIAILLLLGVANTAPIILQKMLGSRLAAPLDVGLRLPDGERVFGDAKTVRGVVVSLVATALAAVALGVGLGVGFALAAASMTGDLASSFAKRRLHLPVHAQASGLDQIPEALLPLLLLRDALRLRWLDVTALLLLFIAAELVLSRILFRLGIRDRPY